MDYIAYMFHFCCPVCGFEKEPEPLYDYLKGWNEAQIERIISLLENLGSSINMVRDIHTGWTTKRFKESGTALLTKIESIGFDYSITFKTHLLPHTSASLQYDVQCPVCGTPPGVRKISNYFHDWSRACKVQVANLLYETWLILWNVISTTPSWASGSILMQINEVRIAVYKCGKALSLLECPQCGRFTSALFGGLVPEIIGCCRWCHDMGGGLGLGIGVSFDVLGQPNVDIKEKDFSKPAKGLFEVLPPELQERMRR